MFSYKSLIIGGLLAIFLIGGGLFIINKKSPNLQNGERQDAREGLKREVAAEGKIVSELPQDLVLPATRLMLSSKTPSQEGFVLSASLITKEPVETIFSKYVEYFRVRDYVVEKQLINGMGSITATKQGRTIKVGVFRGENRDNTSIAIIELIK